MIVEDAGEKQNFCSDLSIKGRVTMTLAGIGVGLAIGLGWVIGFMEIRSENVTSTSLDKAKPVEQLRTQLGATYGSIGNLALNSEADTFVFTAGTMNCTGNYEVLEGTVTQTSYPVCTSSTPISK